MISADEEIKPVISSREEPTAVESPMHHLPWKQYESTSLILSWMRQTGRGYVACSNEFFRHQIGGLAKYIMSNGSGIQATEHYYTPNWPPTFFIKIVRADVNKKYSPLPLLLKYVSENVYELPMWPREPWVHHPQSDEMNEASDILLDLGTATKNLCDNTADFVGGLLPDSARQKLEYTSNYYDHYDSGSRTFYL